MSTVQMQVRVDAPPYGHFYTDSLTAGFLEDVRSGIQHQGDLPHMYYVSIQSGVTALAGKPQKSTAMLLSVPEAPFLEPGHVAYTCAAIAHDHQLSESLLAIDADADPGHLRCFEDALAVQGARYALVDSLYNPFLAAKERYTHADIPQFTYLYKPTSMY